MNWNHPLGAPARFAAAALLLFLVAPGTGAASGPERPLTLEEATERALERNENIVVERAALAAAEAAVTGAAAAYDPFFAGEAGVRRTSTPANSAFSGAPAGESAPTTEALETRASLSKLFAIGGELTLRGASAYTESNASFDLLSPAYDTQLGAEFRQPLLRDRSIDAARLGLRVAAADRGQAAASLRREVIETVAATERAYWTLVAARREVAVREEAVELADEQLGETRIRIETGASPETELAQPRAELERRRGELLAAREAAARAENALKRVILGDADADLWAASFTPVAEVETTVEPVDVATAMARALAERAELAAAEAVVERRRAETSFARDGIRPSLDLVASYDRFGLAGSRNPDGGALPGFPSGVPRGLGGNWADSASTLADGDFDDARLALVFELPLGRRAARADAEIAGQIEIQAEAGLARARKAIRVEVLDAAAAIETAGGRIEAVRAAREAAEVQLAAERERYAVGLSTNFLVLTRQNDLAAARLAEISAQTDYRTARIEMGRATGSLLAERGIDVASK